MNHRFYSPPKEKQSAILVAGFSMDPEDFRALLDFWKKVYLRKGQEGSNDDGEHI